MRHLRSMHVNDTGMNGAGADRLGRLFACGICNVNFTSRDRMKRHRMEVHQRIVTEFRQVETAHRRAIKVLRLDYPDDVGDVTSALQYSHRHVCRELEKERARSGYFKFNLVLNVEFIKIDDENMVSQSTVVPFRSRITRVIPMNGLDRELTDAYQLMQDSAMSFVEKGSGWIVDQILHLDLELAACLDLAGKCYSSHTISWTKGNGFVSGKEGFFPSDAALPKTGDKLDRIFGSSDQNKDCFYIAVARHFNRDETHRDKLLRYAADNFYGIKKSDRPIGMQDIDQFEKKNEDMAINVVYLDEDDRILPVRASPRVTAKHQVVLLLMYLDQDGLNVRKEGDSDWAGGESAEETVDDDALLITREASQQLMHYICIEDVPDFFAKRTGIKREWKREQYMCFNCFNGFGSKGTLRNHTAWCHLNENQRIIYPKKKHPVSFEPGFKACMVPFVIFYDFESLQIPAEKACSCDEETLEYTNASDEKRLSMEHDYYLTKSWEGLRAKKPRLCPHKTKVKHVQKGFAYHIIVMNRDGDVVDSREYVGEDAGEKFCDDMLDLDELLMHQLEQVEPMKMTAIEKMMAEEAEECWICQKPFEDDDRRVRDHDHVTGKFLGMSHNVCNLRRQEQKKIVAFSHNFSG